MFVLRMLLALWLAGFDTTADTTTPVPEDGQLQAFEGGTGMPPDPRPSTAPEGGTGMPPDPRP